MHSVSQRHNFLTIYISSVQIKDYFSVPSQSSKFATLHLITIYRHVNILIKTLTYNGEQDVAVNNEHDLYLILIEFFHIIIIKIRRHLFIPMKIIFFIHFISISTILAVENVNLICHGTVAVPNHEINMTQISQQDQNTNKLSPMGAACSVLNEETFVVEMHRVNLQHTCKVNICGRL